MYYSSWDEFYKAAEKLYLNDPMKVRFVVKYRNCDKYVSLKVTDDVACLQYKTEYQQDLKKIEKLSTLLMRHMAAKEAR
ncbi:Signal recognition particle protein [Chamberlinius hualienensis]